LVVNNEQKSTLAYCGYLKNDEVGVSIQRWFGGREKNTRRVRFSGEKIDETYLMKGESRGRLDAVPVVPT
jgi:hypothetical protein